MGPGRRRDVVSDPPGQLKMLGDANMSARVGLAPENSIARELDHAQRACLSAIRNTDEYLRRAPNGDAPMLVQLKLACLVALDALGKAAQIAENGGDLK